MPDAGEVVRRWWRGVSWAARRLALPLLLVLFGLGVLLSEYAHHVTVFLPIPDDSAIALFAERILRGDPIAILVLVVIAPVLEELIFRGCLLRLLLLVVAPLLAVLLSAFIFALPHTVWQWLPALMLGLLLGWLFVRTRSLTLCIAAHMLWNAQLWLFGVVLDLPVRGYWEAPLAVDGGLVQPVWWLLLGAVALGVGVWLVRARLAERAEA
jgi:membrane protease YdiL (CAAX protease family)